MEIFKKYLYYTRLVFFVAQFILLFLIIDSLFQLGWYAFVFLGLYFIYVVKIVLELLSKKEIYQRDIIYNLMQIGFTFYIFVLFYRVTFSDAIVVKETMKYFMINFGIMSALIIFIVLYSFFELRLSKK